MLINLGERQLDVLRAALLSRISQAQYVAGTATLPSVKDRLNAKADNTQAVLDAINEQTTATKVKISILWGQSHEIGDQAKTYTFDTQAELDAFLKGIEESDGWMGHEFVKEGFVWTGEDD